MVAIRHHKIEIPVTVIIHRQPKVEIPGSLPVIDQGGGEGTGTVIVEIIHLGAHAGVLINRRISLLAVPVIRAYDKIEISVPIIIRHGQSGAGAIIKIIIEIGPAHIAKVLFESEIFTAVIDINL